MEKKWKKKKNKKRVEFHDFCHFFPMAIFIFQVSQSLWDPCNGLLCELLTLGSAVSGTYESCRALSCSCNFWYRRKVRSSTHSISSAKNNRLYCRVAKFKRPRDQKISEDNQELRPGCPPDCQIFCERIDPKIFIPKNLSSYVSLTTKNSL